MEQRDETGLISIVRRPGEIVAFISKPDLHDALSSAFQTESCRLVDIRRSLYPRKEALEHSWQYLSKVKGANEGALYHVLVVLIETAPDLSIENPSPPVPLNWSVDQPARARATSAHPRAFRGTKRQPPKSPRPVAIDLRPHLCNAGSLQALLASLREFLPGAQSRLSRSGYPDAVVAAIASEFPATPQSRGPAGKKYWTLPAPFVQHIWPLVRWRPAREVSQSLSLYIALELEKDQPLLWSVSRLISVSGAHHYSWLRLATLLPVDRRLPYVNALLKSDAGTAMTRSNTAAQLKQISDLSPDEQFPVRVCLFLVKSRAGQSTEYLLAGVRLAAQFDPDYSFQDIGECADFPELLAEEIGIELDAHSYRGWLPMALWQRCGRFPGVAEILRRSAWRSLKPDVAARYFRFLIGIGYSDLKETALQSKWQSIARQAPQLEAMLGSVPSTHQTKAVEYCSDWLASWDDPKMIDKRTPAGLELIRRLAAPPFETGDGASRALGAMLTVQDGVHLACFLSAPDRSFKVLEHACRRDNDADLIAWGLSTLVQQLPGFTIEAFPSAPRRLARTAKMLGGVPPSVRIEICRVSTAHVLFHLDPLEDPIRDVCATIRAACGDRIANPIPARLKAWCRDEIRLSTGSLERYRRVVANKLVATKLDFIEHAVLDRIKARLPAPTITKNAEHALRMLGDVQENRRGLRKFLQAYWSGNREYLSNHPATRGWYREHAAIHPELWERGIQFEAEQLTIQIERDPLEILKLGTYAGTCLGVGGMCSYSAIAALLDINKKVLYARDRSGRVVARQLLAVADNDRLVCFNVYPLSSSLAVKKAFREYDVAFSRALGIPLYEGSESDNGGYQVSSVLSVYWWDDGSWDAAGLKSKKSYR
jgi:hypothetical protein